MFWGKQMVTTFGLYQICWGYVCVSSVLRLCFHVFVFQDFMSCLVEMTYCFFFFSLYIGQTSHESIMYVLCSWTGMILDANFTVANLLGCIWDSTAESLIEARVQWIIETNYYIKSINRPLIKKKKKSSIQEYSVASVYFSWCLRCFCACG